MHRSAILLTTACVFSLTAATLVGFALQNRPPVFAALPGDGGAVVYRFYAAVNDTIATGDASALREVVAADLVEHNPLATSGSGRDGLEAYLGALRAATPDFQLAVDEVVVAGDRVVARVTASGGGDQQFLGVPLGVRPAAWGPVDIFRVAADEVVEHWGFAEGQVLLGDQQEATFDVVAPTRRIFRVDRWTIEPGDGRLDGETLGPVLLRVDGGEIALRTEPGPVGPAVVFGGSVGGSGSVGTPVEPGELAWLTAGAVLFLPERIRYAIWNDGDQTVRLLAAETVPFVPYTRSAPADRPPTDVGVEAAAVPAATDLPAGETSFLLGDVTLAPGGRLSLPAFAGPAVIVDRAGRLQIASRDTVLVQRAATGTAKTEAATTLGPGDSAYLKPGATVDLRNDGEAAVEIIVVALRMAPVGTESIALMTPIESEYP